MQNTLTQLDESAPGKPSAQDRDKRSDQELDSQHVVKSNVDLILTAISAAERLQRRDAPAAAPTLQQVHFAWPKMLSKGSQCCLQAQSDSGISQIFALPVFSAPHPSAASDVAEEARKRFMLLPPSPR